MMNLIQTLVSLFQTVKHKLTVPYILQDVRSKSFDCSGHTFSTISKYSNHSCNFLGQSTVLDLLAVLLAAKCPVMVVAAAAANMPVLFLLHQHHLCPTSAVMLQAVLLVSVMPGRRRRLLRCQSAKNSCSCTQCPGFHNRCCSVDNRQLAGCIHCLGYTLQCFG